MNIIHNIFVFLVVFVFKSKALNNGLTLTPPMGWMSWQRFRCITDCDSYPEECIRYYHLILNKYSKVIRILL